MSDGNISQSRLPMVTVGMPVYNAGKYLRLAVLSIVKQTFTDWELLIIDDGSTDDALEDIADITDPRIQILQGGKNKGLGARLNECIELARGRYFARMDQDDVSYPERFARQIDMLQKNPSLDLVATRAISIDEENAEINERPYAISHEGICNNPWQGFYLIHPTWMGYTHWFSKHRYAMPSPYFCEDQELLLRTYSESRFHTVDEVLFAYRIRTKINWKKMFNTRKALLSVQLKFFMKTNQWRFMILAVLICVLRVVSDFIKAIRQQFFHLESRPGLSENATQWREVLAKVEH